VTAIDHISLPVCTLGAGAMHVAVLAAVLPVLITLPAPGGDSAPAVAIHVEIVSAAPEAAMAEGDAEEAFGDAGAFDAGVSDAGASLGEVSSGPSDAADITAALPQDALPQDALPQDDTDLPAPADLAAPESEAAPTSTGPVPLRKPNATVEDRKVDERKKVRAKAVVPPAPKKHVYARPPRRPVPTASAANGQPFLKGLSPSFGGEAAAPATRK
jgi:hypothetical protein